jgi:hypothetical protein
VEEHWLISTSIINVTSIVTVFFIVTTVKTPYLMWLQWHNFGGDGAVTPDGRE